MVEEKIIHGLYCPECGGTLEIEESQAVVNCPYCGVSSLLTGEKRVWRLQARRAVEQEEALKVMPRFFSGYDKAPDLKRQATINECFLVYLPYWRAWMRAVAWLFGRKKDEDATYPVEKVITEDYVWTGTACDVSEFGPQEIKYHRRAVLELYDREALQREGLVFEPVESSTEAMNQARETFQEHARRKVSLSETRFERFQFLREKLTLIYYPLWIVRYGYRGRFYQVIVDGVTGELVYGRAPGNPVLQAVALVVTMLVGATLPVDVLMLFSAEMGTGTFDWKFVCSCGFAYASSLLSVIFMQAAHSFFRRGGERVVGEKQKPDRFGETIWSALLGGWGLGWIVWFILSEVSPGRLESIIPGYILAVFAGLGLGWIIESRFSTKGGSPSRDKPSQEERKWSEAATIAPVGRPDLSPLRCPNCQTPVDAEEGEVAYLCQTCGWGLELTAGGLRRVEICFAAPQPPPRGQGTAYLPFWVFDGEVQVRKREAVSRSILWPRDIPSADHGEMWQRPRLFYVPAFGSSLQDLQNWGVALTQEQPNYPSGKPCELRGCIYTEEQARQLAELIFLSVEYRKSDVLQEIDYSLKLTAPRLLVVPFVGQRGAK